MNSTQREIFAFLKLIFPFSIGYFFIIISIVLFIGEFRLLESVFLFGETLGNIIVLYSFIKLIIDRDAPVENSAEARENSSILVKNVRTM